MSPQSSLLLSTKLNRPAVTGDRIDRQRLTAMLDRGLQGPLSVVSAAAGFGKTTLVSAWIESLLERKAPIMAAAWVSLDENDSDLVVFLRYLLAAIQTVFPEACPETLALLEAPVPTLEAPLLVALSNEIEQLPARLAVVLDDYHAIRGEAVHDFLADLLRHWPQHLHLVLISRTSPPLPVANLRARGQIVEVRTRDLRFTPQETAFFLAKTLSAPLSQSALSFLDERLEGWIAGLRLVTLSQRVGADPEAALGGLSGSHAEIADYLVDEVVAYQTPAMLRFLLVTSILDRFCVELCEHLLGGDASSDALQQDVHAWIRRLEANNLFVVALDNDRKWYRYHHLFQELLQRRLLTDMGHAQVKRLHRKAVAWFEGQGLIDEALHHAIAGDDRELAAGLMQQGFRDVLNRQDRSTLDRWFRLLPDEFVQHRPDLLMIRVWSLQFAWQREAEWRLIRRVDALVADGSKSGLSADELRIVRGQLCVLHSQAAFFRNEPERAAALCQEALALLPSSWTFARGAAMFYLGLSMQASGRGSAVEHLLLNEYAEHAGEAGTYAPLLLSSVCWVLFREGQLEQLRRVAQVLLQRTTGSGLAIPRCWGHFFLGRVCYEQNQLELARLHFDAVIQSRYITQTLIAANSFCGLVLTHEARGEPTKAGQALELLSQFDLQSNSAEAARTSSLGARLMLLHGDLDSASRWADAFTAPLPDQPLHWPEEPHLTKARILLARKDHGDAESALGVLDALFASGRRSCDVPFQIEVLAIRALALDALGRAADALAALEQAVGLAGPGGFIRFFVDAGPRMHSLLLRLTGRGFAPETLSRILAAFPGPGEAEPAAGSRARTANANLIEPLTDRELDVLVLLRERLSNKEIAQQLGVSVMTIKRHASNIYGKLGTDNRRDAVVKAESLSILPPS